jgi:excisionase family DNA binding protein
MSNDEQFLTTGELAKRLKLKPRGVEGLVQQGKLRAYKVSQRIVRHYWPEVKEDFQKFRTPTKR